MKSINIERYVTFNPTTPVLFEGVSKHSLLISLDAFEVYETSRLKEHLIAAV